jgi:tetratricopeptide (TPR) repeat protein
MVADPRYKFVNFESRLNETGYNLMRGGQMDAALFVFQLNTELFPKSANAWDSLAEVNWKSGKREEAIRFYKKAIELDPNGSVGDNARAMLKEVEAGK